MGGGGAGLEIPWIFLEILQDHPKHILVESYKHNYSRHKFRNDLQLNLNEEEAPSNLYLFHHPWISGLAFYSIVHSAAPGGRSFSCMHSAEVRTLDGPES